MIQIENVEIHGWEPTIRGMRNPMNSWDKSDSGWEGLAPIEGGITVDSDYDTEYKVGPNDYRLMNRLAAAGPVHAKYRRFIVVYLDIIAPLYWWKEFDTYRVGIVDNPTDIEMNSCSTMHKIQEREFTLDDFSKEHLITNWIDENVESFVFNEFDVPLNPKDELSNTVKFMDVNSPLNILEQVIKALNTNREAFLKTNDKKYWWQMIQLLPTSYNQRRTIMLNYEVLANVYKHRKDHKLDEWQDFCKWVETLPCSRIITGWSEQEQCTHISPNEIRSTLGLPPMTDASTNFIIKID